MKKTLNQEIAEQLIEQLEAGNSPFQRAGYTLPVNPTTGKNYRGMTALQLAMLDKPDPRFMTLRQASNAKWKVAIGSKGVLINFQKTQDRVRLLDDEGNPKMNSKNKPMTQLIKLEKPVAVNAFVFNAEQIEDIPVLEEFFEERAARHQQSGSERLAAIGANAKETLPDLDIAELAEPMVIQELIEQTAIVMEVDLENPVENEMRTTIAAMLINNELGLEQAVDPNIDFDEWVELIREQPDALEVLMTQAQYVADDILKLEPKREQQQTTRAERTLQVGDVIPYNDNSYEVLGKLKKNAMQVQESSTGNKFRVSPGDGIYASLVQAKLEMIKSQKEGQTQEQGADVKQGVDADEGIDEDRSMEEEFDLEQEEESELELELNAEQGVVRAGGAKR